MGKNKVIIIGGGAAGLMAASQATLHGADTLIIEKMQQPGRKLRITGKGRCNLTNIASLTDFIGHFGKNGRFLRQAFNLFFSQDLIDFFRELGVPAVVERGGRVFPASEQAQDIVDSLINLATAKGARIQTNAAATGLIIQANTVKGIQAVSATPSFNSPKPDIKTLSYEADAVIIATGGSSYPATGSTGDGYRLAAAAGHTILPIRPALVPLETEGDTAQKLQGLSLKNIKAKVLINGKKTAEEFGEMVFTHFGLSGPIILSLSITVVDALQTGQKVSIALDLKPALDERLLDARLVRDLDSAGKRHFSTVLKGLLPRTLIPVCLDLLAIPPEKPANQISATERKKLRLWLKDFRFPISRHRPLAEAIVTAGGVDTKEIDPRTMASRLVTGLYFAGEVMDVQADTGGYNLQAAFSTGRLAGQAAAGQSSIVTAKNNDVRK